MMKVQVSIPELKAHVDAIRAMAIDLPSLAADALSGEVEQDLPRHLFRPLGQQCVAGTFDYHHLHAVRKAAP